MDRVLSQEEIDSVFRKLRQVDEDDASKKAQVYDFRRPDRIAKDQLRAIHLLHETFTRNLASSLSAYLRAYVAVNLVSVEQLAFMEFTQGLPAPTSMVVLGLKPYEGNAVLEINPSLVFPILEMLLGGKGKATTKINREVTEIEQSIFDGLLRIVLNDLRTAWHAVANIEFAIESHETEPQLLQMLAPNEAVVAVTLEVRIGEATGLMNLGIPSIVIKMLRQKFDQQWSTRKTQVTEAEYERVFRLVQAAKMELEVRLDGPVLPVEAVRDLREDDIIVLDFPTSRSLDVTVNGLVKYRGAIVSGAGKRALQIQEVVTEARP